MAKKPNNRPLPQAAPVRQPVVNKPVKKETTINWFSVRNLCIALAVIACALYVNTLQNGYILDDTMVIKENLIVQQGIKGIPELFLTPHMRGYMAIPNDLYRPLSLVMFAVEVQFFGLNPFVGHLFNVLTFMGCVLMLFLFLNKLFEGKKTAIAFIAALVFALHPIHTEVVANIKSRDELLCYFFGFLSLNLFMYYMKSGKMWQLLLGAFALYLSYISKETVIAFVAIIPLIFFFYYNEDKKRAAFITGGMGVATLVFMVVRYLVLAHYNANQRGAPVDFIDNALSQAPSAGERIATELFIIGKYLVLMIVPYPLLSNYSFRSIPFVGFGDYRVLLSLAAYAGLIVIAIMRFIKNKKDPWVFAIVFYLGTLALFSNFPFLMGAEMAERFAFFASTGVCIAVALAIEQFILKARAQDVNSLKSGKVMMIMIPLMLIFGGMTIARNADWKDQYTLYKTDLEKSPNDSRLYQYLATAMAEDLYPTEPDSNKRKSMDLECVGYLKKALEIYPDFAESHVELGRLYERARMYVAAYKEDSTALALKPFNATGNNNMGSVLITTGRYREAIPYLKKSVEGNPNFKFVYLNLARSYKQLKVYDSAATNYRMMLMFDPNYADGIKELATVYFVMQKFDSAAIYFRQVTNLAPNDPDAFNNLGAVYLNGRKYDLAIGPFTKAISLNPNYIMAYSNLGRTYFMMGRYADAIDIIKKGMGVNPKYTSDIQNIAISYQKMGKMDEARQYEAMARQVNPNFKLE